MDPDPLLDDKPAITQISINPQNVQFNIENDGFKDTTLDVGIYISTVNIPDDKPPQFAITNKISGEQVSQGSFDIFDSRTGNFGTEITLQTTTTSFDEYIINVFPSAEQVNGNYAQTIFTISGVSNNNPLILEANNPEEVQLPSSGTENVEFSAKVTDEDGQSTIENVFMWLISQNTGEVSDSPFLLYDDGNNGEDSIANDSLYTLTLEVSPQNQPDIYDVKYYAIDRGGLVSDTVETTFRISE